MVTTHQRARRQAAKGEVEAAATAGGGGGDKQLNATKSAGD